MTDVVPSRGRSACGPTHVARLEFPRETGLILRCAGKAGNPFQTTQGNGLSCRDQEGRRGSEEAVPDPRCSPRGNPACRGTFESCQGPFRPSGRNRGLPLRRRGGQGPHLAKRCPEEDKQATCAAVTPLGILFLVMFCCQSLARLPAHGWENFEPVT